MYRVIFRADRKPDGTPGEWVLSSKEFKSFAGAQNYRMTISPSREARVVADMHDEECIYCGNGTVRGTWHCTGCGAV